MTESEGGSSFTAADVVLALWRDGEPLDDEGMPTFFESALIAQPGHDE